MTIITRCMVELSQTNSIKDKEEILKKHDSPELREFLDIALNPYRVFYVSKFPTKRIKDKDSVSVSGKGFTLFKNLIRLLESREISGHTALNTIFDVFSDLPLNQRDWYQKALCKESIGVGVKTVNKAFGDLIPEFAVMLADNKQPKLEGVVYPVLVQPKLDGFRAIYIPGTGFMGRNGKALPNVNFSEHFPTLFEVSDFVFDGELYSEGGFNTIASVLNSEDKPLKRTKGKEYNIRYHIYDGMPLKDWKEQGCKLGYSDRQEEVNKRIREIFKIGAHIRQVSSLVANNQEELEKFHALNLKTGFEGSMLKDPNGLYQWKRVRLSTQTMMKLKPIITEDVKVTGFVEGEGRLQGKLGKLLVDFNGVKVGVGTGFTDTEREKVWNDRPYYIGKMVEVKGMEKTPDGSIRHPVFVRWRMDK